MLSFIDNMHMLSKMANTAQYSIYIIFWRPLIWGYSKAYTQYYHELILFHLTFLHHSVLVWVPHSGNYSDPFNTYLYSKQRGEIPGMFFQDKQLCDINGLFSISFQKYFWALFLEHIASESWRIKIILKKSGNDRYWQAVTCRFYSSFQFFAIV